MPKGIYKRKPISKKTRIKLSLSLKGNKNGLGKNLGNKNALGKVLGENNGNYKDGLSYNNYLKRKEKIAGRKRPDNCEICGAMGQIDFDHNHETEKFRGWICRRCNLVLGMVKDNFELLSALSNYLKNELPTNNSNPEATTTK